MAEGNGAPTCDVIRIGRKGRKKFALGDGEPFDLDVVGAFNQWCEIDRGFEDAEGKIPADKWPERDKAVWKFAKEMSRTDDITLAEALEFVAILRDETEKLRSFFERRSGGERSSPGSTELTFSP